MVITKEQEPDVEMITILDPKSSCQIPLYRTLTTKTDKDKNSSWDFHTLHCTCSQNLTLVSCCVVQSEMFVVGSFVN